MQEVGDGEVMSSERGSSGKEETAGWRSMVGRTVAGYADEKLIQTKKC